MKKTTEEWLFELGYDCREDNLYGEEKAMVKFMKEMRKEQLREAQLYIDDIENCEDDHYIEMKNYDNDDYEENDDWESIDSVADGLGFYIDDDGHWIPND